MISRKWEATDIRADGDAHLDVRSFDGFVAPRTLLYSYSSTLADASNILQNNIGKHPL